MDEIDLLDVLDVVDDGNTEELYVTLPRKYLADVKNPLEVYNNDEFMRRYRLSKDATVALCDIICNDKEINVRAHGLPPITQLTCALRFFATGHFQQTDGDLVEISRRTAQRSIHKVARAICNHKSNFIGFPGDSVSNIKQEFYAFAGFPNVLGAIDCTHIPIASPGGDNAEVFRNRKMYFSLNVQAVCNAKRMLTNIVVRWPGSTHDARIFENSVIRDQFENQEHDGFLLGDNGYGLKTYLLTPLLMPTTRSEIRYNQAHIATRSRIEQCFGVWKQRFRALRIPLRIKLENAVPIIIATACLHNHAMKLNQPLFDAHQDDGNEENGIQPIQSTTDGSPTAVSIRQSLISQYFS